MSATPTADAAAAKPLEAGVEEALNRRYGAGFVTDIETESLPPGLDEDVVRAISARKNEPGWMTEWRLAAYRHWLTMTPPDWAKLEIAPIDYQAISYFAAPKNAPKSLDEIGGEFDAVITMGCGDSCPWVPARIREDWALPDPKHMDDEGYRAVRDTIEARVRELLARL